LDRILIVNVNWIGDVLFSTPAIRAIRKKYPKAYIASLVPPRGMGLLKNNPYLDEVIVGEDKTSAAYLLKQIPTILELRKRKFDTAVFFHRSRTRAWLAKLAGVPKRAGFESPLGRRGLTRAFPSPSAATHRIDLFLDLVEKLGIQADGRGIDFFPAKEAEETLSLLLERKGIHRNSPYVVLHAGGNWDMKRWPTGYFAEWIKLFLKKFSWTVVLCGQKPEEAISREISSYFSSREVVSLCGQTSLDELAILLKRAKLLLSNDSGPLHLAASQKTPLVGLFGPTSPEETGPVSEGPLVILRKDVGCEIPCYYRSCNYRVCMDWLTPEEVFEKTKEMLITNDKAQMTNE